MAFGSLFEISSWSRFNKNLTYFVFTADRLFILIPGPKIKVVTQMNKMLENNSLDSIISKVFICDLLNRNSVRIGFFALPLHMKISSKKITLIPVGEHKAISFSICVRFTNNGKIIHNIYNKIICLDYIK